MIASMTGFGKASINFEDQTITAEMRGVNNRYLDISTRLPRNLYELELPIKEYIKSKINRGKITLNISWDNDLGKAEQLIVDEENAQLYYTMAKQLKNRFNLPGEVDLKLMLSFPDLLTKKEESLEIDEIFETIKKLLDETIEDFNSMRYAEGKKLAEDMLSKIEVMDEQISTIEADSEKRLNAKKEQLREKVSQLLDDQELDEQRLMMEIVLLADKLDVDEECVRFHSHNKQFKNFLEQGGEVGKKLKFLLQEMHREANTIGAKINDSDLTLNVITLKEEIEKLREQVQNIE